MLDGPRLTWHLVCKGQMNMDLAGDFNFDSPHHYTGTVRTKAEMAGMQMIDTRNMVEGQWVSACPPIGVHDAFAIRRSVDA